MNFVRDNNTIVMWGVQYSRRMKDAEEVGAATEPPNQVWRMTLIQIRLLALPNKLACQFEFGLLAGLCIILTENRY
jgi:hypothetical protein